MIREWLGWGAKSSGSGMERRSSKTQETWRSVFDPGSNPNVMAGTRDYYDHVKDPANEPSMWDMILKSEALKRTSFSALDRDGDGRVSRNELAAALAPAGFDARAVDRAMAEANAGQHGLDRQQFAKVMDRHFGTA